MIRLSSTQLSIRRSPQMTGVEEGCPMTDVRFPMCVCLERIEGL
jgi:hypothetical protein